MRLHEIYQYPRTTVHYDIHSDKHSERLKQHSDEIDAEQTDTDYSNQVAQVLDLLRSSGATDRETGRHLLDREATKAREVTSTEVARKLVDKIQASDKSRKRVAGLAKSQLCV